VPCFYMLFAYLILILLNISTFPSLHSGEQASSSSGETETVHGSSSAVSGERVYKRRAFRKGKRRQEPSSPEPSDEEARKNWLQRREDLRQAESDRESPEPSEEEARMKGLQQREEHATRKSETWSGERGSRKRSVHTKRRHDETGPESFDEKTTDRLQEKRDRDERALTTDASSRGSVDATKKEVVYKKRVFRKKERLDDDASQEHSGTEYSQGPTPEPSDEVGKKEWLQRRRTRARRRRKRSGEESQSETSDFEEKEYRRRVFKRKQPEVESNREPTDEEERKEWLQRRRRRSTQRKRYADEARSDSGGSGVQDEGESSPEPTDEEAKKLWLQRRQKRKQRREDGKERVMERRVFPKRSQRRDGSGHASSDTDVKERGYQRRRESIGTSDEWSYSSDEEREVIEGEGVPRRRRRRRYPEARGNVYTSIVDT
jgi:hypothetical protein